VAGQELSPWYRWLLIQLIKTFYRWASDVVVVSRGAADDFLRVTGLPPERVKVIYNPIVTPELRRKAKEALVHPWFAAGQPPVVLGVGRLSAQKDFGTLIHAFARVRETCTARLMILGEGEDRPMLETLIASLGLQGDVEMPGFVANPYTYMTHARLFVLSSRWEGLPTVLVEALFCGLPVVATDCPSGPREILQGGQYGRLVPVGDVTALAQTIQDSLAAQVQPPPVDSWMPFEQATVVDQYLNVLFGS
jgi:glycosyltransferase involved in cell wall biosynthesis